MKKILFFSVAIFLIIIFCATLPFLAMAQSPDDVQYPVAELGNCESREACHEYCNIEENHLACIEFAKSEKIYSNEKADRMAELEKFKQGMESAFKDTPGGCVAPRECDAYCRIEDHLDECLAYSVKIGHTTQEEVGKIKEKANKGGPGGCKSKETCKNYCQMPKNRSQCNQFLVDEGKLTPEEAQFAEEAMREAEELKNQKPAEVNQEKAAEILKTEAGPGGCKNVQECSKYCGGPEHMEECLSFAQKKNLIDPENLEKVKKLMSMGGPGGCRGQEECKAYCDNEEHRDECMNFSLQAGTMTQEQYDRMNKLREMMDKTSRPKIAPPGGCKTDEECNQYCSNSSHIEECIDYARGGGRISGEIIKNMMGKTEDARQKFEEMRREMEKFNQSESGGQVPPAGMMPPPEVIQQMKEAGIMPPENFQPGPGQINPGGQMMPPQAGPGGCKTPEECQAYCSNPTHQEECSKSGGGNQQQPMPPQGQTGPNPPPPGAMPPADQNIQNPQTPPPSPPPEQQTQSNFLQVLLRFLLGK
jgi:hypothetical protein